jgi:hypothetical protein
MDERLHPAVAYALYGLGYAGGFLVARFVHLAVREVLFLHRLAHGRLI